MATQVSWEQTGSWHPDLECRQTVHGAKPGDWFVRVTTYKGFTRVSRGHLVPRATTGEPTTLPGRAAQRLKRLLVGRPVPTVNESHERLGKLKGLVVLSSDALSSVTYATEEIMKILVLAGALSLTLGISAAIVLLLAIVVVSYRQTIRAYPSGGGSYIVASDNLGILPGLTAAAALLIDYVLTVSVSVAAGIANLVSLRPELLPHVVPLCVAAVLLLALANLRGLRDSGTIFLIPTYLFVATVYVLIGWGTFRLAGGQLAYIPPASVRAPGAETLGVFLVLRAFAQGCTALTGTEAISNGVPAFRPPEARNARDAGLDGRPRRHDVPGAVLPGGSDRRATGRCRGDGALTDRPGGLRRRPAVGGAPGRGGPDPGARGEHLVRRFPAPGLDTGARRFPAPHVSVPGRPPGLHRRRPEPRAAG